MLFLIHLCAVVLNHLPTATPYAWNNVAQTKLLQQRDAEPPVSRPKPPDASSLWQPGIE